MCLLQLPRPSSLAFHGLLQGLDFPECYRADTGLQNLCQSTGWTTVWLTLH